MSMRIRLLLQVPAAMLILAFVPTNLGKLAALLVLWALSFGRLSKVEAIFYVCVCAFFTAMNAASLKQGIFMFAHPRPGRSARQEYLKGEAEDHFRVVSLDEPANVPFRSFRHTMLTKEWTPLEPGVIDHKYYARGIGTVLEQTVKGGDERDTLVSVRRGP